MKGEFTTAISNKTRETVTSVIVITGRIKSPPLISSDTLKELGMLQIREYGSFGQPNIMRIQDETSSANGRPCSEDTSTRNVNTCGEDMVPEAAVHEKEAYQTGRGTGATGSSKQQPNSSIARSNKKSDALVRSAR